MTTAGLNKAFEALTGGNLAMKAFWLAIAVAAVGLAAYSSGYQVGKDLAVAENAADGAAK